MKLKATALLILSLSPAMSMADSSSQNFKSEKSGLSLHIGYANSFGDMVEGEDTTTGVSLAAMYTFDTGHLIGITYIPTATESSFSRYGVSGHVESSVGSIYAGYQTRGWRYYGGLSLAQAEASVCVYNYCATASDDEMGLNAGIGYEFNSDFMMDFQFITLMSDYSAMNANFMVGYKF